MSALNYFFVVILTVAAFSSISRAAGTAEFDQDCNTNEDCLSGSFLYCNKWKKCDCMPGVGLIHDVQSRKCAIPMGNPCHLVAESDEPTCTSNSGCEAKPWMGPGKGLCTCAAGLISPPNTRRCLKQSVPIGEYCELGQDPQFHACSGFSKCQSGKCICENSVPGADIIVDPVGSKCALATGSSCDVHADPTAEPTCSSNSKCLTAPWLNPAKGICTCDAKYELHPTTRTCGARLANAAKCELKNPTQFVPSCIQYSTCDPEKKECGCWSSFEVRNGDNSVCHLKGNGLFDDPCMLKESNCQANSVCVKQTLDQKLDEENEKDIVGLCKCSEGHEPNPSRICIQSGGGNIGGATTNFLAAPVILVFGIFQAAVLMAM